MSRKDPADRTFADYRARVQYLAQLVEETIALATSGTPQERAYAREQLRTLDDKLKFYTDILDGTFRRRLDRARAEEGATEPQ